MNIHRILFFINLSILLVGFGAIVYYQFWGDAISLSEADTDDFSHCSNLSVSKTANCLKRYVSQFYNYTSRDERYYNWSDGNLEDVMKNGGDCYDYSRLYISMAKELGFHGKEIIISSKDTDFSHAYALIWAKDLSGYCTMEALSVNCVMLDVGGN